MASSTRVSPHEYRFDDLTLDVGRRRVLRGSDSLPLSDLTFELLRVLVEAAPNVVSHDELAEKAWGPRRVVTPENLAQRVMVLRHALGDSADQPRYIEGIRGRGYRLIPEVRATSPADPAVRPASTPPLAAGAGVAELTKVSSAAAVVTDGPSNGYREPLAAAIAPMDPATTSATRPLRSRRFLLVAASFAVAAIVVMVASSAFFSPSREPIRILVLPFPTPSQDPEQRALADALTGDLISRLRALPGLRVMGTATSFALRASTVPDVAANFGVQFALEGSVSRAGDEWRIHGQLSDAAGFSVWGFDSTGESLLDIQDDIVTGVAAQLRVPIDRASRRAATDDTHRLYLAAWTLTTRAETRDVDSNLTAELALRRVNEVLELDNQFVDAWSLKAELHSILSSQRALPQERARERASGEQAAEKAIELAPDWGRGYSARVVVRGTQGKWAAAQRDYQRVQDLAYAQPSGVPFFLLSAGRVARARETLEAMLEDDPLNATVLTLLMLCHEISGQPEEADRIYQRWLRDSLPGFATNAWTWIRLGRGGDAGSLGDALYAQFGDAAIEPADAVARLHAAAAQRQYGAPVAQATLAIWAAHFGEVPLAVELLEEATAASPLLTYVAWLPVFDAARRTQEFKELVEEMELPQYWHETGWPDVCRPAGRSDFACD